MNKELRDKIKYSIKKQLIESNRFHIPVLEFIIRKEDEYICYVMDYDNDKESIIILSDHIQMIPIEELVVNEILDIEIEGCVEAYLFSKLNFGYEIVDIHQELHEYLWDFIEEFKLVADLFENGVINYLRFCMCSGITYSYMKFYNDIETDLYEKYHVVCPIHMMNKQAQRRYCNDFLYND